jgi:hypothetical protein
MVHENHFLKTLKQNKTKKKTPLKHDLSWPGTFSWSEFRDRTELVEVGL